MLLTEKFSSLSEQGRGVVALVMLAFVFATMGVFARYLSTSFALFEQTYLRVGLACLLGALFFVRGVGFRKYLTLPRRDAFVLALRAVALYLGVVLFTEAILHAKFANVSFITTIPMLPLLAYFFLKEKLLLRTVLFIALGFLGIALITLSHVEAFTLGYGELIALCSAVAFNLSYIGRRFHSNYLDNKESAVLMFFVGALFLFVLSMIAGESLPARTQVVPFTIGVLLIAALLNVANLFLTNYGFERVKAGVAGNILTLETLFALVYAVFLYQEIPLPLEIAGGVLIVVSVYLVNKSEYQNAPT